MSRVTKGSIHGRFQPFHNAHLAYALAALQKVEILYIGLTRVLTNPGIGKEIAPHRLENLSNPLSYYQRVELIKAALGEAGIHPSRVEMGPFPIEEPVRLLEFWPLGLPCFTTIVDRWNVCKIEVLRKSGYEVIVLEQILAKGAKTTSGTEIRRLIRQGDPNWEKFVPRSTIPLLKSFRTSF
jgi:nicotinamide mononucleotide adenylyltransferase